MKKNKDKEIIELKMNMNDLDKQITKKDLEMNQVEASLQSSKIKVQDA